MTWRQLDVPEGVSEGHSSGSFTDVDLRGAHDVSVFGVMGLIRSLARLFRR
jgi:hypothetical protein